MDAEQSSRLRQVAVTLGQHALNVLPLDPSKGWHQDGRLSLVRWRRLIERRENLLIGKSPVNASSDLLKKLFTRSVLKKSDEGFNL